VTTRFCLQCYRKCTKSSQNNFSFWAQQELQQSCTLQCQVNIREMKPYFTDLVIITDFARPCIQTVIITNKCPTSYVLYPTSYVLNPTLSFLRHTSSILLSTYNLPCPRDYTLHPHSYILHLMSCVLRPTSSVLRPKPSFLSPTSSFLVLCPTSYNLFPTSYILRPNFLIFMTSEFCWQGFSRSSFKWDNYSSFPTLSDFID
jgi:hypothetical protein